MNAVLQYLHQLDGRNYVRKANNPRGDHWHYWAFKKMQEKCRETGGDFFLILFGSRDEERDFFVIPYGVVQHLLTEERLGTDRGQRRWTASIHNNKFKIRHCDEEVDVTPYYGNMRLLEQAIDDFRPGGYLSPEDGDAPTRPDEEDAGYVPTDEDSRAAVMRQIKVRRGQQVFRNALRDRYGDRCVISGCRLMDVVEAAHIRPYRGEQNNRPTNGLLLRADLHTLFDLDLIGIEPDTLTVRVHPDAKAAGYEEFDGAQLQCGQHQPSPEALAVRWQAFRRRSRTRAKPRRAAAAARPTAPSLVRGRAGAANS